MSKKAEYVFEKLASPNALIGAGIGAGVGQAATNFMRGQKEKQRGESGGYGKSMAIGAGLGGAGYTAQVVGHEANKANKSLKSVGKAIKKAPGRYTKLLGGKFGIGAAVGAGSGTLWHGIGRLTSKNKKDNQE